MTTKKKKKSKKKKKRSTKADLKHKQIKSEIISNFEQNNENHEVN